MKTLIGHTVHFHLPPRRPRFISGSSLADKRLMRLPSILARRLLRDRSGQSLLETALFLPILVLVMAYAVDYSYFFFVAADLTSAARAATEYSIEGSQGPSQVALPAAGPLTAITSVASLAVADLN